MAHGRGKNASRKRRARQQRRKKSPFDIIPCQNKRCTSSYPMRKSESAESKTCMRDYPMRKPKSAKRGKMRLQPRRRRTAGGVQITKKKNRRRWLGLIQIAGDLVSCERRGRRPRKGRGPLKGTAWRRKLTV